MRFCQGLAFWCVFIFAMGAFAQSEITVSGQRGVLDITSQIEVGTSHPFENDPGVIEFKSLAAPEIETGYSADDQWIRFALKNTDSVLVKKLIYVDSPLAGKLTLFNLKTGERLQSGPGIPLQDRHFKNRLGAFLVQLEPGETIPFVLKRSAHHAFNAKVLVSDRSTADALEDRTRSVFFFYMGGIFCLVIYNLLLSFFTSRRDYLLYSLFAASFGGAAMASQGVLDTYVMPLSSGTISNYLMAFSAIAVMTSSVFAYNFLGIKKDFKVGYWGLRVFIIIGFLLLLSSPFLPGTRDLFFLGYVIDVLVGCAILFYIYCGIYVRVRHHNPLANYFLLSWSVVGVGTLIWILTLHGVIKATPLTSYSLLLANLGEMLVLSMGLAHKIKTLDLEKARVEQEAEDKERYHRLVRVLSHDVANTAAGLMYHGEMLKEISEKPESQRHASRVVSAIENLNQILKSVRQEEVFFSVRSYGELETLEVLPLCHEALQHCAWSLNEKGIQVEVNVPAKKFVKAEKTSLVNQVLLNVLSNSIKFSDSGCRIFVTHEDHPDRFILHIRDEGVGIHSSDLPHLFKNKKMISRKGTANEEGTGIGTTLMAEYMKLYGGEIKIHSVHHTEGKPSGTTVTLIFPLAE